jgi:small-conductance mechanosensitive channel
MTEAAAVQERVLAEPPPKVFLTQFADSSINLELGFWIDDPGEGQGQHRLRHQLRHLARLQGKRRVPSPSRSAKCGSFTKNRRLAQ